MSQHNHYKQIFSQYSGYVYQFIDTVPAGESPQEYVINQFATEANKQISEISVTQLPDNGAYVIHSSQDVMSEKFVQLADLSYQAPLLEIEIETESETESESKSDTQGDK